MSIGLYTCNIKKTGILIFKEYLFFKKNYFI